MAFEIPTPSRSQGCSIASSQAPGAGFEEVVKVAVLEVQLLQDGDDPFAFGALGLVDGCDHNVCGNRVVHPVELEGIDAVLEVLFLEKSGERH